MPLRAYCACKRPFAGPRQVPAYIGRYTHRIAISNHRIVAVNGDQVTFLYEDRADGDQRKRMTLTAEAFLRRFLLHVLPPRFVRIRHYGLLANPVRHERIALCRQLLHFAPETIPSLPRENWEQTLMRLTGEDITHCPLCGALLQIAADGIAKLERSTPVLARVRSSSGQDPLAPRGGQFDCVVRDVAPRSQNPRKN